MPLKLIEEEKEKPLTVADLKRGDVFKLNCEQVYIRTNAGYNELGWCITVEGVMVSPVNRSSLITLIPKGSKLEVC